MRREESTLDVAAGPQPPAGSGMRGELVTVGGPLESGDPPLPLAWPCRRRRLSIFVVVFNVAGLISPPATPLSDQTISDLGIGTNDWLLNTSLIFLGDVQVVGATFSLYRSGPCTVARCPARRRIVSLAAVGVGYAVAGFFPETNPSITSLAHRSCLWAPCSGSSSRVSSCDATQGGGDGAQ